MLDFFIPSKTRTMIWPTDKIELLVLGLARMEEFCKVNNLYIPSVKIVPKAFWPFSVCAFYRPDESPDDHGTLQYVDEEFRNRKSSGINVCLEKCQVPCGVPETRNWSWPGSLTDREPYGVILHELGHHADREKSTKKGSYFGDYSINIRMKSKEKPVTSYCENDHEWFAEMFRVFAGNPGLLKATRPKTYSILCEDWTPVGNLDWRETLGENVPPRVIRTSQNKIIASPR